MDGFGSHEAGAGARQCKCTTVHTSYSCNRCWVQGWGYNTNKNGGLGPLWKSTSGEYSNLRWDIAPEHVQYFWKKVGWRRCIAHGFILD